jgi:16S rRNA (guanine527-N7)-methyltransferase
MSLGTYHLGMSSDTVAQLDKLVTLFLGWNKRINLSALRTRTDVELKHVVDSLLISTLNLLSPGLSILDLGTGGGFPGLPLALCYSDCSVTMVDSVQKKIAAVASMADNLGLTNVKVVHARIEELGQDQEMRERFDLVVARALAGFSTLLEYSLPFVNIGGHFVAYQGPDILSRVEGFESVIQLLGGNILSVTRCELPNEAGTRIFVIIQKVKKTPVAYPRKVGIPKKNPL